MYRSSCFFFFYIYIYYKLRGMGLGAGGAVLGHLGSNKSGERMREKKKRKRQVRRGRTMMLRTASPADIANNQKVVTPERTGEGAVTN